jgi:hypothetical protein
MNWVITEEHLNELAEFHKKHSGASIQNSFAIVSATIFSNEIDFIPFI